MASTNHTSLGSIHHRSKELDSELYNGGPVGPIPAGPYLNGTSTNGTSSPAISPRLPDISDFKDNDEGISMTESPSPQIYPRRETWPRASSPSAQVVPSHCPHEGDACATSGRARPKMTTYTENKRIEHQFPRISRPVELLRSSYDCVVIGSGYGGGVAASRMARAGKSVCLLERGREKWPGEYPTGSAEAIKELHCSGTIAPGCFTEGLPVDGGDPTGMYHLIFGKGQNAIVGNGEYPTAHKI